MKKFKIIFLFSLILMILCIMALCWCSVEKTNKIAIVKSESELKGLTLERFSIRQLFLDALDASRKAGEEIGKMLGNAAAEAGKKAGEEAAKEVELKMVVATNLHAESKSLEDTEFNTKELQRLVDEMSKNGGGTIKILDGNYYFTAINSNEEKREEGDIKSYYVIQCKDNVTIEGTENKTVLRPYHEGEKEYPVNMFYHDELRDSKKATYLKNVTFKNFEIDSGDIKCETYNSAGNGFSIVLSKNLKIENVVVRNTDGTGISIDGAVDATITNCKAINCGKTGNNERAGASGFGIGVGYSEDESVKITKCEAIGNKNYGFAIEHLAKFVKDWKATSIKGVTISECSSRGNRIEFGGDRAVNVTLEKCYAGKMSDEYTNPMNVENEVVLGFGKTSRNIKISEFESEYKYTDDTDSQYMTWTANNAITDIGNKSLEAKPQEKASRAMAVVMLWRADGRKGDVVLHNETVKTKYTDVKTNNWYTDAIKWAEEQKIITSDNKEFRPDDGCLMKEFITMLWRYAGSPEAQIEHKFSNSKEVKYYEEALNWAISENLISEDKSNPDDVYTREDVARTLYEYMNKSREENNMENTEEPTVSTESYENDKLVNSNKEGSSINKLLNSLRSIFKK